MDLNEPRRLSRLKETELLDSPAQETFDRFTRLAAKILDVPVSLITLVDLQRQFFLSCTGLPEPWQSRRETPLTHSFCQHVVTTGEPLVVNDARLDSQLKENLAIPDLGVVAYLGFPLVSGDAVLGSFCAIDSKPRAWTRYEVDVLGEIAALVAAEIDLHIEKRETANQFARSEALLNSVADGIYALDSQGICTYANPGYCRMFGFSFDEVIGRDLHILTHHTRPDGTPYPREECPITFAMMAGERVLVDDEVMFTKSGKAIPVEYVAYPIRRDDTVTGVAVRITDISLRKEREEQLALQKALLAAQAESILDAMLIVDSKGRTLWSNRRFRDMWRLPPELIDEGSDKKLREWAAAMVADPQGFQRRIDDIYGNPMTPARDEVVLRDGRVYDRYGGPVLAQEGTYFGHVWLFREITELKRAQQQREEVLAIVSHDLRNPLATIYTSASVLLELPLPEESRKQHLEIIRRTANSGTRLIQNLLDVSRLEAGRLSLDLRAVDVETLVAEAVEIAGGAAAEKQIRIETQFVGERTKAHGDRDRLLQVLVNLISNAVKFTPQGGRIVVTATTSNEILRFSIEDSGEGIAAEHLPHIFDRYWQAHHARRAGAGLGLAIVRGIVEAHGGQITVRSELGKGSTFEFTLSRATSEETVNAG